MLEEEEREREIKGRLRCSLDDDLLSSPNSQFHYLQLRYDFISQEIRVNVEKKRGGRGEWILLPINCLIREGLFDDMGD